jgi:hypothetical protein
MKFFLNNMWEEKSTLSLLKPPTLIPYHPEKRLHKPKWR